MSLINAGRPVEAESRARALLALHPEAGILWKVLGVALIRQGRDALGACTKAAELLPTDAEAQHNLGVELVERKQHQAALPSLRRAVSTAPKNAEYLVDLADALREAGDVASSIEPYQRALQLDGHHVVALNNLGNALMELRRPGDAIDYYRRALMLRPNESLILCNLSNALRQHQHPEDALAAAQHAFSGDPRSTVARNYVGLALLALGRRAEAIAVFRDSLMINPKDVIVMTSLAQVLRETGERHEALDLCLRAVELDPTFADGFCNLGNLQFDQRCLEDAGSSYQRALAIQPRHVAALTGLGLVLRQLRRPAEAEAACRSALAVDARCVEALSLLGELRADLGHFDEAETIFTQAIAINPRFAFAYSNIAAHRRMTGAELEWLEGAEALLAGPLPTDQCVSLHFALGKFFDDTKQYDRAFAHFRQGNELTRSVTPPYDPDRFTARIDHIIHECDGSFIQACQPTACSSDVPVFIIGMPRSGTSLAEQILASHESVFGAGEISFWDAAFDAAHAPTAQGHLDPLKLTGIAAAYLDRLRFSASGAMRIVDKMPANFMYAGLIHAVFPNARIIHMQRDPLDTCLSIYFQNFFSLGQYTNDLGALVHYYREYTRMMDHWRKLLPATALLEVPYEELAADQETWTRRLIDFVGLPWDPKCLAFQDTSRAVVTASKWQVRQKMHTTSAGRWRHYAAHLGPLRTLVDQPEA